MMIIIIMIIIIIGQLMASYTFKVTVSDESTQALNILFFPLIIYFILFNLYLTRRKTY